MKKRIFCIVIACVLLLSIPLSVGAEWLDEGTLHDRRIAYNYAPMTYHLIVTWDDHTQRFIDYRQGELLDITSGVYSPSLTSPDGKSRVVLSEVRNYQKLSEYHNAPVKGATTLRAEIRGNASVAVVGMSTDVVTVSPNSSAPSLIYRDTSGTMVADRQLWDVSCSFSSTDPKQPNESAKIIEYFRVAERPAFGIYSYIKDAYNNEYGTNYSAVRVYNYKVDFNDPCELNDDTMFIIQQPKDGSALALANLDLYLSLVGSPFTKTDEVIDRTLGLEDATVVDIGDFDFFSWLESALTFLDVPLFGDFTLGGLLSVVLGISVLLAFLKIFAGG